MANEFRKNVNVRLTPDEIALIEEYQQRLQAIYGDTVRVTQRTVIVEALRQYRAKLEAQERDRQTPTHKGE